LFFFNFISIAVAAQLTAFNNMKKNMFSTLPPPPGDIELISYYEYGFGIGASYDRAFADLKRQDSHPGYSFNVTYNFNPFLPLGAEFQFGTLEGGGRTVDKDLSGRYFKNNYKAMIVRGDLLFGQLINYSGSDVLSVVKDFFIGGGIGAIGNNIVDVQRTNLIKANGSTDYVFPGRDASLNLLFTLRFGYELKLYNFFDEPRYHIALCYQHNIVIGEGLDGYNDDPRKFKNNAPDQYGQISLVFRMDFGETTVYTKFENYR
jgi:hypothetical protein